MRQRLADDVELRPVSPFYRIRFDDGAVFDYTGDAGGDAAPRWRGSRPATSPATTRFMQASEAIFRVGFEQLGHVPFGSLDRHGADRARSGPAGRLPHASTAWSSSYVRTRGCASVLSFHPLLIGGNPFTATSIYSLIAFLERRWGVHFAMGGTGQAGARAWSG